jgi:hypothetical protein
MPTRPRWRLPLDRRGLQGNGPGRHPAFVAAMKYTPFTAPQCEAIAKSTGLKCKMLARRGTDRCHHHGGPAGLQKALEAEAERYGKPVIADRSRQVRKRALAKLATTMPWPDGLPKRPDLLKLGVIGRGRLFEAWLNRHSAPDVWEYELRPRIRNRQGAKNPL